MKFTDEISFTVKVVDDGTDNVYATPFADETVTVEPIISDETDSAYYVTVTPEEGKELAALGLKVIENKIGVLTNNPPFSYHIHNLSNYMNLTVKQPVDRFAKNTDLQPYSLGMGAIGLPGDFSSASRFIRCAFIKENSVFGDTESQRVGQVFHILDSVSQFDGCTETPFGHEKTLYSICCNATKGKFYYTTYYNRQIAAIDLHKEDLNSCAPITFPLLTDQQICEQNSYLKRWLKFPRYNWR